MVKFIIPEDKGYLIVVIHQDNSMLLPKTLQGLKIDFQPNFFNFLSSHFFVAIVRDSRPTPPIRQKEKLMEAKIMNNVIMIIVRQKNELSYGWTCAYMA